MLFLLLILLIVPAYAYYDYTNRPTTPSWSVVGDLQVRATSVTVTGLTLGGPGLSLAALVFNPNGFGVSLVGANYSIYADGHFLVDGRIVHEYALSPLSTEAFAFPFSIGWGSAFQALGSYMWAWGNVNWEVKGTASIQVGGLSLTVPFDLTTTS